MPRPTTASQATCCLAWIACARRTAATDEPPPLTPPPVAIPAPVCAACLDLRPKLALLIAVLPFLFALMFAFVFLLPGQASGRVVGSLFDRVLDALVGPEPQEIVITGKRRHLFLKF